MLVNLGIRIFTVLFSFTVCLTILKNRWINNLKYAYTNVCVCVCVCVRERERERERERLQGLNTTLEKEKHKSDKDRREALQGEEVAGAEDCG